jgi:RNA polymerase sigma-70 factor (ECF subfamily)
MRATTCEPGSWMDESGSVEPGTLARGSVAPARPGERGEIAAAEPQLQAIAERLCATSADARDLVQDTLERAMRQGIPNDVRNTRAYLATIMHNLFIDRCRAAKRRPSPEPLDDAAHASSVIAIETGEEPAWTRVTLDDVREALAQIDPTFARVYMLHAFEHRSYEQIANELAIERATVGTRLNRARVKLRRILVERFGLEETP